MYVNAWFFECSVCVCSWFGGGVDGLLCRRFQGLGFWVLGCPRVALHL